MPRWGTGKHKNKEMKNDMQDVSLIKKALADYYFKGIYEGDLELLKRVYADGILLFGDVQGQPYFKTLAQYLDGVKNRKNPKELGARFETEIISVNTINSIAVAELNVKMYDFDYHEFLSFHKLGGKWLIVNKMLTDVK